MRHPEMIGIPVILLITVAAALTRRWLGLRARQVVPSTSLTNNDAAVIEARLSNLEHGMDAIALEIERIGEGQRFVTKLLSERATQSPPAPAARERVVTPH